LTSRFNAKRFAKVAGEMVPLGAVEDFIAKLWPDAIHAVVAMADQKRGEQLVLVTDCEEAARPALAAGAREAGLPEMFVPRAIVKVEAVPLLGTGKIDYVGAMEMAVMKVS
jgi:acyl-[acyl-carrier-protein]-phospholipid O-acyltransferase/long-chain-fatty-acid--[acyl-carrier-protein] ligase